MAWEAIGGMRKLLLLILLGIPVTAVAASGGGRADRGVRNDYPTAARADYVFACMQVNGQTRDALDRCSCAIDVVASILPYKNYVSAETVLRMQREKSLLSMEFRTAMAKKIVRSLREAEAEGEVRCF